jgi:hypothetical protein
MNAPGNRTYQQQGGGEHSEMCEWTFMQEKRTHLSGHL